MKVQLPIPSKQPRKLLTKSSTNKLPHIQRGKKSYSEINPNADAQKGESEMFCSESSRKRTKLMATADGEGIP